MKLATLLLFACAVTSFAQGTSPTTEHESTPTITLVLARIGERIETPQIAQLHYFEFLQIRNRWIYPDLGYVDFGSNGYREMFVGGGRRLIENKFASWDQELFYLQATGPDAGSAKYIQPWTMVRLHFTPKFSNETVYFPYFPLNSAGHTHHVIERSKFEYTFAKHWKAGPGYSGLNFGAGSPWQNRPFITTTIMTGAGDFEFWLQKVPNGAVIQFRYALLHKSH